MPACVSAFSSNSFASCWHSTPPRRFTAHVGWLNHVNAAAIWLTTAFVVALLDRYLWDAYFEKKRQTPIPHFPRQVVALLIYAIAVLLVLIVVYHAKGYSRP